MPSSFRCDGYGDEIVCVSRVEHHKRQHLLIEALHQHPTPVKLRLCGISCFPATYSDELKALASRLGLDGRVVFEQRWISEEEKVERLAPALAAAYIPFDEDSYGYPSTGRESCAEGDPHHHRFGWGHRACR